MPYPIYVFIIVAVLVSCRTQRDSMSRESLDTQTDNVTNIIHGKETAHSQQEQKTHTSLIGESGEHSRSEDRTITITEFSLPDSTGKQHVTKQTTIESHANSKQTSQKSTTESSETTTQQSSIQKEHSEGTSNTHQTSTSHSEQETHTETTASPTSWFCDIIVLSIVCYLLYRLLKYIRP